MLTETADRVVEASSWDALKEKVAGDLERLEAYLQAQIPEFEGGIQNYISYAVTPRGKRLRSVLTLYSGWQDSGQVTEEVVRLCAILELVHMATLIHDDILDHATLRRNQETLSAKYGSAVAVLVGDALFAHALKLAADYPTTEVCRIVTQSVRRVCSGEIEQTLNNNEIQFSLERYLRIIDLKTAELFKAGGFLGAKLGGYSEEFSQAAQIVGEKLGLAYQIYDDWLDLTGSAEVAQKTLGSDLSEGKVTLPWIILWNKLDSKEREQLKKDFSERNMDNLFYWSRQLLEFDVPLDVKAYFEKILKEARNALSGFEAFPPYTYLSELLDMFSEKGRLLIN